MTKFTFTFYIWESKLFLCKTPCALSHLLLHAVCSLRPLGGAAECSTVVTKVTGRVHLMLNEIKQRRQS